MKSQAQPMVKLPATIVEAAASIAQSDGDFPTSLPGLSVHRRSAPAMPMPCIYGLGLGLTLQGGKQVMLGDEVFDFVPGNSLLTTVDLPVVTHISTATREEPFLGILVGLDAQMVLEESACLDLRPLPKSFIYRPVSLQPLDAPLVDALVRMIKLTSEPHLVNSLAPLIRRELTVRLLTGPHGPHLRHIVTSGTPSQQIARVMGWLKKNFHRSFSIEELASSANMSPSTFRQHFREIARMSPLQYQKQLRLQEARQLMLNEEMDANVAGIRVGYESPSQFSREYARLFGAPPLKDIRRLRLS